MHRSEEGRKKFGLLLIQARENAKCSDWVQFSEWLHRKTGYKLSKTVLHNHGRGYFSQVNSSLLFALEEARLDDGKKIISLPFRRSDQ